MRRRPKFDDVIDGVRVRVYATRGEYEVIFHDEDINDETAHVLVYPKVIGVSGAARQGRLEMEKG